MALARPILLLASFERRGRAHPFKPLKATSRGKMGHAPWGFDGIDPSSGAFVVEYASMSFLLMPLNLGQSPQTSTTTLIFNRP
jgi:hypothetical protein